MPLVIMCCFACKPRGLLKVWAEDLNNVVYVLWRGEGPQRKKDSIENTHSRDQTTADRVWVVRMQEHLPICTP
jgi:hypothetical protein